MADVFVSYVREDRDFVRRLTDALKARGLESWVDWEGIEPSDEWRASIREAIEAADAFLVVLSPALLASRPCRDELDHATAEHKRLIVVVREDVEGVELPASIEGLNWIFLREEDAFEQGVDIVERALALNLDLVRIHTRVLTRARAWDLGGRRPTPLLRGEELRAAQRWIARAAAGAEPQPTELQAAFVEESRHRAARRQRLTISGSLSIALISAALAAFALVQRAQAQHQARIARSRQLAAEAEAALAADPEAAIRLAADAVRVEATPQAVHALSHGLDASRLLIDLRQRTPVDAVGFAPGGRELAVGSRDGTVTLWRLSDRRVLWSQHRDPADAAVLAFASRGDVLAVSRVLLRPDGSSVCSVQTLSAATGAATHTLQTVSSPSVPCTQYIAFRGQTRTLTVVDPRGAMRFFDVDTGRLLGSALAGGQHTPGLTMGFSSRGDELAIGGGGIVRIVSVPSGRLITRIPLGEDFKVNTLAFSPDAADLVISETTLGTFIEDVRRHVQTATLQGQFSAGDVVAWAPDDRLIVGGSREGQSYVWARASGRTVDVLHNPSGGTFNAVSFSRTGLLATGSEDGSVRIWAPDPDLPAATVPITGNGAPGYASSSPKTRLAAVGDAQATVVVLTDAGRSVGSFQLHGDGPFALTDSGEIVFARGGSLVFARARTGGPERSFRIGLPSPSDHLATSSDGHLTAVASLSQDASTSYVTVFNALTRTAHRVTINSTDGESDVALSANGSWLAIVAPPSIRVLRTSDLRIVYTEPGLSAAFSPTGRFLAVQHNNLTISILRSGDWGERTSITGATSAAGLAMSPGDRLLAASSGDGVLRLWDARDGTLLATRFVTDLGPVHDSSQGLSPPVVTHAGLAMVGVYNTGTADVFDICPNCLDPIGLLEDAEIRLHAIAPVAAH